MKIDSIEKRENIIDYDNEMEFTLLRMTLSGTKPVARLGVLFNTTGSISLFTCENAEKIIPEGDYMVTYTRSSKFSGLANYKNKANGLVPLVMNVPGRNGIRIHIGNFADESTGCILIGAMSGSGCVYKSVRAYEMLMNHVVKFGLRPMHLRIYDVDSVNRYSTEEVKEFAEFLK